MVVSSQTVVVLFPRRQSSTLTRLALLTVVLYYSRMNMNGVVVHGYALCRNTRMSMRSMIQERRPVSSRALRTGLGLSSSRSSSSSSSSSSTYMRDSTSLAASSTASSSNTIDEHIHNDARSFLGEIETTVANVLNHYNIDTSDSKSADSLNIKDYAEQAREAVGIARHLDQRLQAAARNNDCRTCWLQRAHCICRDCPPIVTTRRQDTATSITEPNTNNRGVKRLRRLFLVYHHKEICLAVDTAKLLVSTLYTPQDSTQDSHPYSQVRVVVGGIPAEFQESMKELEEAVQQQQSGGGGSSCLVLFPDEKARTWKEFQKEQQKHQQQHHQGIRSNDDDDDENNSNSDNNETADYDVIVLDGTWEQARKLYRRYVPDEASGGPYRIQLELEALGRIVTGSSSSGEDSDGGNDTGNSDANDTASSTGTGRQLRRHPVLWREIGTTAATGSLLQDMDPDGPWETTLARYQQRADAGARAQLGAPRMRMREQKQSNNDREPF